VSTTPAMLVRQTTSVEFPSWPVHSEDEVHAAVSVLRSGHTNQWTGPEVREFENAFADWIGVRHTLAVANGSVAVELALHGLEIGAGDEVLVPARSYVATAMAPELVGADARLVDADASSGNVTVATLERARTPRTTAAIVAHVAGWPCDMPEIMQWAAGYGIRVVEDCAQAHGAAIAGRLVGGFGHASAFSFSQGKIMSLGGEGGAVCTNDPGAFDRGWSWREHGKIRFGSETELPHVRAGSNLRMTGFQAAIGLVQLQKMPSWSEARRANIQTLATALLQCDAIEVPLPPADRVHAGFMLGCLVRRGDRDGLLNALAPRFPVRSAGVLDVATSAPWCRSACGQMSTPVAADIAQRGLLLPVHPTADASDIEGLATAISDWTNGQS